MTPQVSLRLRSALLLVAASRNRHWLTGGDQHDLVAQRPSIGNSIAAATGQVDVI